MCDFWSSVALTSRRYYGQPMAAHLPLPIDTPHFNRWLELFVVAAHVSTCCRCALHRAGAPNCRQPGARH